VKFELALRVLGRKYREISRTCRQAIRTADDGLVLSLGQTSGRRCVYNFGVFSVAVPGAVNFRCQPSLHWSGATHGALLNDN